MLKRLAAAITSLLMAVGMFSFAPQPVRAATDWSFETSATDSGWEIEVEPGSAHDEGDCTDTGETWLELEPVQGECFVQFSQGMPTAFALHHALPGGRQLVFRHVDNQAPFLFAIDSAILDGNEFRFTMASENLDNTLGYRFEDDRWSYLDGDDQQKMGLFLLNDTPENWFDFDQELVDAVLIAPGDMEVDHDGVVNDGDTDGTWAERVCNLRTGTCDGYNGDLQVTLYDNGGSLDPWDPRPLPWENNNLRGFTKCDTFNMANIYSLATEGQPYGRYYCDADHFIAHYTGTLTVPESGNYTFAKSSDDGLTVFVDGEMVIGEWGIHGMDDFIGETLYLEANHAYPFEAWFYDGCCGAGAILLAGIGEPQIVPATWFGGGGDPSIISVGSRKIIGSTIEFANTRIGWVWLRCTSSGSDGEARRLPRNCRVDQRGQGLGTSLSRSSYLIRSSVRFVRLAIYSGGSWHYSATYEAP